MRNRSNASNYHSSSYSKHYRVKRMTYLSLPVRRLFKKYVDVTVPRIRGHNMIRDNHSSSPRRSITTFLTILRITVLSTSCSLSTISFSFAAELFPFAPPSTSQQRPIEQHSTPRSQLPSEEIDKISKLAAQAKQLSPLDQKQLKENLRRSLDSAIARGNLNQVQYYNEVLRQIE